MVKTKKERKKEKSIKLYNKRLVKKYPWLKPYNVWTGKPLDDYNYEFVWIKDDIFQGWWKCFGEMMCKEIDDELKRSHSTIKFQQVKEKYGRLEIYCFSNKEVNDIITKYSIISENVCIRCGKPDVHMIDTGWVIPECKECFSKHKYYGNKNYSDYICDGDGKISDTYSYRRFSKDGNVDVTVDISETVERIRKKYYK